MNNKNNIVLIIMVAAAVVFAAVGLLVLNRHGSETPTPPAETREQTPEQVVDKDYQNTRFGFRFVYPSTFADPDNVDFTSSGATGNSNYFVLVQKNDTGFLRFSVKSLSTEQINLSLDELIKSQSVKIKSKTSLNLGSEAAVRAQISDYEEIFVKHKNYLLRIEIKPGVNEHSLDALNGVLASFQFTNSTSSSTAPNIGQPKNEQLKQPTVQSFTVMANDFSANPSEIKVAKGTIVDLTFVISANEAYYGGLEFRSSVVNTGPIANGATKTIAFTAAESFELVPYWPSSGVRKNYTVKIIAE